MGLLDVVKAASSKVGGLLEKVETKISKPSNMTTVESLVKEIFPENARIPILANIEQESSYNWEAKRGRAEGLFQLRDVKSLKTPYAEYLKYNDLEDSAKSQLTFVRDMLYGNTATGFSTPTHWKGDNDTERATIGAGHGRAIRSAFKDGWAEGTDAFIRRFERPVSEFTYKAGEKRKRKQQAQIDKEWEAEYDKRIGHAQGWVDRYAAAEVPQVGGLLSDPMAMP